MVICKNTTGRTSSVAGLVEIYTKLANKRIALFEAALTPAEPEVAQ